MDELMNMVREIGKNQREMRKQQREYDEKIIAI